MLVQKCDRPGCSELSPPQNFRGWYMVHEICSGPYAHMRRLEGPVHFCSARCLALWSAEHYLSEDKGVRQSTPQTFLDLDPSGHPIH